MMKLRFEFTLLPGNDGKSNIYSVTSIATPNDKIYIIPEELQAVSHHKRLLETPAYNKVKNSLKKRYQTRKVWITLTEELAEVYMDEDGNLQFEDQYLEEANDEQIVEKTETKTLEKLFEKFIGSTQEMRQQTLKQIAEKFIIEKFTTKSSNANLWIDLFERECARFDVATDEKKIEILRLFIDENCADWYNSMLLKLTLNSDWSIWRNKFCETFANKGWNPVTHALLFKYRTGSLLEYAIKKEKLLLDMRTAIDTGTLIDLIAAGLPELVLNRIDRETLKDPIDLFNELSKHEHIVVKKRFTTKKYYGYQRDSKDNTEEKNPCKICESMNKGRRYHAEAVCWFRPTEDGRIKKNSIRHVNNSVIEAELNESDQKNE